MFVCTRISDDFLSGAQGHAPRPGAMEAQAAQDYGGQPQDYAVREVDEAAHAALVAARDAATPGHLESLARQKRDSMLAACDWTQMPDAPLAAENKAGWAVYRQALRDVPQQQGFPGVIDWPKAPQN